MPPLKNLTGQTFGRWLVIKKTDSSLFYECLCKCGEKRTVRRGDLTSGKSKSCGCYKRDRTIETKTVHGCAGKQTKTREYKAWEAMKRRCYNKEQPGYKDYGGRGIRVCSRWINSFENFYKDMGTCPKGMSLERINNNKGYEPDNCKWENRYKQSRNKRNNVWIEYNGKTMILSDWAKLLKIKRLTLYMRIYKLGWPIEKALSTPPRKLLSQY